ATSRSTVETPGATLPLGTSTPSCRPAHPASASSPAKITRRNTRGIRRFAMARVLPLTRFFLLSRAAAGFEGEGKDWRARVAYRSRRIGHAGAADADDVFHGAAGTLLVAAADLLDDAHVACRHVADLAAVGRRRAQLEDA